MSDFRKLDVWERSHALLLNVHSAIKNIRGADYVSLRNQMLRAGMSVPGTYATLTSHRVNPQGEYD